MDGLSENQRSFLGTYTASSNHNVVVLYFSVVDKSSHWVDIFLGQIELCGGVGGIASLSYSVDFFVHLCSLVITELTASGNGPLDSAWVPGSDTTNFSESSMGLSGQLSDPKSLDNSGESVTLGGSDHVDHFEVLEDLVDRNFFFEKRVAKVNLLFDVSSVDLDLVDVGLFGLEIHLLWLGVADESDHRTVLDDSVLLFLGEILVSFEILLVVTEGSLLGAVPVLVESSLEGVADLTAPETGKGSEPLEGLNVADHSNHSHGRGLKDGDCLNLFLLVQKRSDSLILSDYVSHSSLDSSKGGKMRSQGFVLLREGLYLSSVVSGSSLWKESEISLSWLFKLSVGHGL